MSRRHREGSGHEGQHDESEEPTLADRAAALPLPWQKVIMLDLGLPREMLELPPEEMSWPMVEAGVIREGRAEQLETLIIKAEILSAV